jgi:hypothetical protein
MKSFTYQPSQKISNWGHSFDSLLELKYAISIGKEYFFIRSPVLIYYDPRTNHPVDRIRKCHRRYTPDFLIRHKETKQAFLIEIKPRAFEHQQQLIVRKEVAENYIRKRNLDWTYKVVFDDQMTLSGKDLEEFHRLRKQVVEQKNILKLHQLYDRYDNISPSLFKGRPSGAITLFVLFGEWSKNNRSGFFRASNS